MQLQEHISLAPYTTFQIGGAARYFAVATSLEDIREALQFAKDNNLSTFVLGGGSNLLVDDAGFDGLVIKLELKGGFKLTEHETSADVVAGAGESWDELVRFTVEHNLWGIENLSGIPGTVGGAVVQNIGAYGAALSEVLTSVEVLDTTTNEVRTMTNTACVFEYRDSFFKHDAGRHIVLSTILALSKNPRPNTSYKDLAAQFGDTKPTLTEIREAVLAIRKGKFPDLSVEGTAGSFFKNPIMSHEQATALKAQYPEMPLFTMPETEGTKVPLAWLLDNALSLRGAHVGGARLFDKQVLVISASRGTSSHDVRALASMVQQKVFDTLGISIEPEVKIL